MSIARLVTHAAAVILLAAPVLRAADLASAKALYAAASYEEALAMLATIETPENLEQVNQIRALCQLALGRTDDAQQSIQAIVLHNPLYQLEANDVSPKLVSLFRDVRRQTLPTAARTAYAKAKERYDAKQWSQASDQLTVVLTILNDTEAADPQSRLADLRQLAEGFLMLARNEMASEERRAEEARRAEEERQAAVAAKAAAAAAEAARKETEATAAAASSTPPARAGTPPVGRTARSADGAVVPTYSIEDRDVTPPVEVSRAMPRWVPTTAAMAAATYSGRIEVVIDNTGAVTEVAITKPIAPRYDEALRDLALTWRYRPATRNGKPVRYRQLLEIVLRPPPK